jgi:hypothetical protein
MMNNQAVFVFRLSIYLTLSLACLCLSYATYPYLPQVARLGGVVGILIVLAFLLEGRWELSLRAANILGGLIGLATIGWLLYTFNRPVSPGQSKTVLAPSVLLPYLGPLLMILIPAKLFRPKDNGDFWAFHGIGLIAVSLGCALSTSPVYGLFVVGYLLSALWSLSLFFFHRHATGTPAYGSIRRLPLFFHALGWLGVAVGLALLALFVTPGSGAPPWERTLGRSMETGFPDDIPHIDLKRTGTLTVNDEVVLQLTVVDRAGNPRNDLTDAQKFRGGVLRYYENGNWVQWPPDPFLRSYEFMQDPPRRRINRNLRSYLPDMGPDSAILTFNQLVRLGPATIVADPLVPIYADLSTVVSIMPDGSYMPWVVEIDGSLGPIEPLAPGRTQYRQVIAKLNQSEGDSLPIAISDYIRRILSEPARLPNGNAIRRFGEQLIRRLVEEGKLDLPLDDYRNEIGWPRPQYHAAIAKAFEQYFRESGEYTYSLNLERVDADMDPLEDFLFNEKKGHCERYAGALALLLRSQRIPSQVVLGFRGADQVRPGHYVIRQSHAHAWVEALVPHDNPPTQSKLPASQWYRWLALDPTPSLVAEPESQGMVSDLINNAQTLYSNVLNLTNNDRQELGRGFLDWVMDACDQINDWFAHLPGGVTGGAIGLIMLGLLMLTLYRFRVLEQLRRQPLHLPEYRQLTSLLARVGYQRGPSETSQEFSERVAASLATDSATAEVARVPAALSALHYRVVFGESPATDEEREQARQQLTQLRKALQARR